MIDIATRKPVRVSPNETVGPYIRVSLNQLEQVRKLLLDNNLRHWVGHTAISVDGGPMFVTIHLAKGTDSRHVQALLDQAA